MGVSDNNNKRKKFHDKDKYYRRKLISFVRALNRSMFVLVGWTAATLHFEMSCTARPFSRTFFH
jgi:hypothetical protein